MFCPFITQRTTTEKDGVIITKETHMDCCKEECPYYSWRDWNKAGQGCTKARAEIERERRASGY